jgi:hypothetical protein
MALNLNTKLGGLYTWATRTHYQAVNPGYLAAVAIRTSEAQGLLA